MKASSTDSSQVASSTKSSEGKKSSNPYSTGGGGFRFEQKVQAYFVVLYLIGGIFPIFKRADCFKIVLQARRKGIQTDDLVVYFKDDKQLETKILIQVKHKLTFTESDDPTGEALTQAWIDFHNHAIFNPSTDRIAFVTGELPSALIDHVKTLFEWARCSENEQDFMEHFLENAGEKKKRLEIIRGIIKRKMNRDVSELELWRFLKALDLLHYDFDSDHGRDTTNILEQIRPQLVHPSVDQAQAVWYEICSEVGRHNVHSGTITRETLAKTLTDKFSCKTKTSTFWHLPPFDTQNFIGNEDVLDEIVSRCEQKRQEMLVLPIVGLGGLGKTYLALKSINLLSKQYSLVAWFDAKDRKSIEEQFLEFAKEHTIYIEDDSSIISEKIEKIKNWLLRNEKCLLLFDNAEDYSSVKCFLPHNAHILITSVNSTGWSNPIVLNTMKKEDAVKLLRQEAGLESSEGLDAQLEMLTDQLLGNLPLAIAQAGAYIGATGRSISTYIGYYQSHRKRMLEDKTLENKRQEHHSVYITFEINIIEIQAKSQLAVNLLNYCAHLNSSNIPRALLELTPDGSDAFELDEGIALLGRYSLIKAHNDSMTIHCVVQDVILEKIASENLHVGWMCKVINLLNNNFSYIRNHQESLAYVKILIPHMLKIKELALAGLHGADRPSSLGEILYKIGVFHLDYLYDSKTAEEYLQLAEPLLKNPDLQKRNARFLIKACSRNKNYEMAEKYVSGFDCKSEEDVDVLCTLGNYYLHKKSTVDHFDDSLFCFRRALAFAERDNDDEKISMVHHYFGTAFMSQGNKKKHAAIKGEEQGWGTQWINERKRESDEFFDEGLKHYKWSLELKETIYPEHDPEVARTQHQAGKLCFFKGDFKKAKEYLERAYTHLTLFYADEPKKDISDILFYWGQSCCELGQSSDATQHFQKAVSNLEKLPDGERGLLPEIKSALKKVVPSKKGSLQGFFKKAQAKKDMAIEMPSTSTGISLTPAYNASCETSRQPANDQQEDDLEIPEELRDNKRVKREPTIGGL